MLRSPAGDPSPVAGNSYLGVVFVALFRTVRDVVRARDSDRDHKDDGSRQRVDIGRHADCTEYGGSIGLKSQLGTVWWDRFPLSHH